MKMDNSKADMDIYDVSDDLVKKLNDWKLIRIISCKFKELKENYSRVNFVEHALIDFKYIEKIMLNVKLREEKCNKKSSEFRMLGNEQFSLKNRQYFKVNKMQSTVFLTCFKTEFLFFAAGAGIIQQKHLLLGARLRESVHRLCQSLGGAV